MLKHKTRVQKRNTIPLLVLVIDVQTNWMSGGIDLVNSLQVNSKNYAVLLNAVMCRCIYTVYIGSSLFVD